MFEDHLKQYQCLFLLYNGNGMAIHTHVLAFFAKPIFCFQFVYSFQSQIQRMLCTCLLNQWNQRDRVTYKHAYPDGLICSVDNKLLFKQRRVASGKGKQ